LRHLAEPAPDHFRLADEGRQYWAEADGAHYWLAIGRNLAGNERLERLIRRGTCSSRSATFPAPGPGPAPGPSLARRGGADAAAFFASYSPRPRARAARGGDRGSRGGEIRTVEVTPNARPPSPGPNPLGHAAKAAIRGGGVAFSEMFAEEPPDGPCPLGGRVGCAPLTSAPAGGAGV
jgi:hypothetical protein